VLNQEPLRYKECVHWGLLPTWNANLCEICCYDAPRTTIIVLQFRVYFIRCVIEEGLLVQEGADEKWNEKAH
jgi:hypothetical protein